MKKQSAKSGRQRLIHKVFVSASHKDRDLGRDLARRLKEVNARVIYSELTLSAGSEFEEEFIKLLEGADEIILILTNNSIHNLWMIFEIGAAFSLRKKITPVVVGLEDHELPPVIKQLQYIRYDKLSEHISSIGRSAQAA